MKITIKDLVYSYRDFTLEVKNISFSAGKTTVIVGPNGAGKTTLLKCMGAVLPLNKESVYVGDEDVSRIKSGERAKIICYVPQEQRSVFNFSVLDFVLMGRTPYHSPWSSPRRDDLNICHEALDYVGMADFRQKLLLELSSGERRLVLIARALVQQADIFLMDEPTTFLDPRHEREVLEIIRRLSQERGKTVLMTLHNLQMSAQFSDVMVFLKKGTVVASGNPDKILTEELLQGVYDIPIRILEFEGKTLIVK